MPVKDRFLNKSNSYNFYKNEYARLIDENDIEYSTYTSNAFKQQHLIFTEKYNFFAWL